MGFEPPTYDELPLPTRQQFGDNPDYCWRKLEQYRDGLRLFGLIRVPQWLFNWISR